MSQQEFIETLTINNSNYNNPQQAITTANLCNTISRDINTDSKRFIYELLQNADDASNASGRLDVSIDFMDNYVIISHKGEPFSAVDIESISSAGDGTKAGDSNKTGFKGIGFKSVFSHVDYVMIKSQDYCFRYDKSHWNNFWNESWGQENLWKEQRRDKSKSEEMKMPWQIIPIETKLPDALQSLSVFDDYKVCTVIRYNDIEALKHELKDLFSNSQILLFLRSKEVKISIHLEHPFILEKQIEGNELHLKENGSILSSWLMKTDSFDIPEDIHRSINRDDKSPEKLKEARRTEISFAIQIKDGKLLPVSRDQRLIFTYLPTSINYDFPFLVNASFLTDAGREHLHQDSAWNQWLFHQISYRYFTWMAELAQKTSPYHHEFLKVIPSRLSERGLGQSFNKGYSQALKDIAFIPNMNGELLKVGETIVDETHLSEVISPSALINYINETQGKAYTQASFVPLLEPLKTLRGLGSYFFNIDALSAFLGSDHFVGHHTLEENFDLIEFLQRQNAQKANKEDKFLWNAKLKEVPFIFDQQSILRKPRDIYFPVVAFSEEFSEELSIVNEHTMAQIETHQSVKKWLDILGVKEPADDSFIEKTIIGKGETYITQENALAVGKYLFKVYNKGGLDGFFEDLHCFKLLTNQGSLVEAKNAYLSDFYEPKFSLEELFEQDCYVSSDYYEEGDMKLKWRTFLLQIGVVEDISWEKQQVYVKDINQTKEEDTKKEEDTETSEEQSIIIRKERPDNALFQKLIPELGSSKYYYRAFYSGNTYSFIPRYFNVHHFSYFTELTSNYKTSKIFWARAFQQEVQEEKNMIVHGICGYYPDVTRTVEDCNYFDWTIKNLKVFPTTMGDCSTIDDIFINTPENRTLGGEYLPVLDYDGVLSEAWQALFLKKSFELGDYLHILEAIAQKYDKEGHEGKDAETSTTEKDVEKHTEKEKVSSEDRQTISKIYQCLEKNFLGYDSKIQDWGKTHKLLAQDDCFYDAEELSLVTVDGFKADKLVYTPGRSKNRLQLMRLLGVQIIDTITPSISNSTVVNNELRLKLLQISSLIALLSVGKQGTTEAWEKEYQHICRTLTGITFWETESIYLSYGNEEDKQKRSSWAKDSDFYYVGKWYSPRVLDGLVNPISSFLHIEYASRELSVLILETLEGGLEYLSEKEYDISLIPEEIKAAPQVQIRTIDQNNRLYNQSDANLGKLGEKFVYEALKKCYSERYHQKIQETSEGFKVGDKVEVLWRNISSNTTSDHDFKIIEADRELYIDCKATAYGKNVEKLPLFISGRELALMENVDKYLIARVYNVTSEHPSMELVRMTLDQLD